jgi:uncharacterized oxidoreductase
MQLESRTVLITGGASGIGLALAEQLLLAKCRVIVCGRTRAKLAEAEARLPGLVTLVCDITRPADVQVLRHRVNGEFGGLDILVNNACIGQPCSIRHNPDWLAQTTAEIETNLLGAMRLTAAFLDTLLARPEAVVVNVTSGLAICPSPVVPGYSAAKAGLRAFTRVLRCQLRGTSVRVVEVLPPMVDTGLVGMSDVRKMGPAAVAAAMVRGLRRNRTEIVVREVRLMLWAQRVAPGVLAWLLERYPFPLATFLRQEAARSTAIQHQR